MTATLLKDTQKCSTLVFFLQYGSISLFFVPMILFFFISLHLSSLAIFLSYFLLDFFLALCIHPINAYFHSSLSASPNHERPIQLSSVFLLCFPVGSFGVASLQNITIIVINIIRVTSVYPQIRSLGAYVSCTGELSEMNSTSSGLGGRFFGNLPLLDAQSVRLRFRP